jgi:glutamate-1-semialdehyde 2,1-aminomutase
MLFELHRDRLDATRVEATPLMTTTRATALDALIENETEIFLKRQPRSRDMIERARGVLAGGATSNWQIAYPQAVWLTHGKGSKIYDVDGTEYSDFHGGYGVSLVGHAHPAIVAAVSDRVGNGTHFAQPTEDAIVVAENLRQRFRQPLWRYANSGTEATMDAVHMMRAFTGRDLIIKVEGCYHGHHDSVQVSVLPDPDDPMGPDDAPVNLPSNSGIPAGITDLVVLVPFNNLDAVRRVLEEHRGQIAGMIVEPIMMNAGIIHPLPGYLAGLKQLLHEHDALLTFDEVKTGLTAGPSGATGMYDVTPDLTCLAKAVGGGVSVAAIGGRDDVMAMIADGRYDQVGTFNGNPLAIASAKATLTEILDGDAYAHIDSLRQRISDGLGEVIARYSLPWHVTTAGAKGCVTFLPEPTRNFREFLKVDGQLGEAHWLVQHNGGVFLPPWGKTEQWLMSVQHTDEDVDRFVGNFANFAEQIAR